LNLWLLLVAFFGGLMGLLSLKMIFNPKYWAAGIVSFSRKIWFHYFEIVSRFIYAIVFLNASQYGQFPKLYLVLSGVLTFTTIYLIWLGEKKHKQFAIWSSRKFKSWFRPLGILSFGFGVFLVYSAI